MGADPLAQAPKPVPVDSEFEGCGGAGHEPDHGLNRRKNRIDEGDYLPTDWSVVAHLPWPHEVGYRFRSVWAKGEARAVAVYEGAGISVIGFVAAHRIAVPEPTNCYSRSLEHRDYHLVISQGRGESERESIVTEITPRVRARHPRWTLSRLDSLQRSAVPVRVSGWLLLDQMHPEHVGRNRITLWEVHPVMRIEWRQAPGVWISLDSAVSLPPPT
ncbi:MAG TPA: hypothetical protein VF483_01785 [Gemmatimonadaceae bacterium]